jgi:glycolate oxidase iron-sulfur subunit
MAVCPVYGAEVKESAVARAKIALGEAYLEGKIKDKDLMNLIYNCLVCKSCMLACP